jgi:hypothetical protein
MLFFVFCQDFVMIEVLFCTSFAAMTLLKQGHAYHFKKLTDKSFRVFLSCLDFLGGLVFGYVLLS